MALSVSDCLRCALRLLSGCWRLFCAMFENENPYCCVKLRHDELFLQPPPSKDLTSPPIQLREARSHCCTNNEILLLTPTPAPMEPRQRGSMDGLTATANNNSTERLKQNWRRTRTVRTDRAVSHSIVLGAGMMLASRSGSSVS